MHISGTEPSSMIHKITILINFNTKKIDALKTLHSNQSRP